jgi:hypothetical protein
MTITKRATFRKLAGRFFHNASKVRDAALVGAAILYGVGYIFWSLNAWRQGLGALPALEVQYFVAGILPSALLILLGLALWLVYRIRNSLGAIARKRPWATRLLPVLMVCSILFAVAIERFTSTDLKSPWRFASDVSAYVFIAALILQPLPGKTTITPIKQEPPRSNALAAAWRYVLLFFWNPLMMAVIRGYQAGMTWTLVGASGILGLAFILLTVYPAIPQALGGVASRCAHADLEIAGLGTQTREALLGTGPGWRNQTVAPSLPLDVFYSLGDTLIVKPKEGPQTGKAFELPRTVVRSIAWC